MAKPSVITVDSLVDFVREIDQLLDATKARNDTVPSAHNWYRGHGLSKTHKLLAGLFRIKKASSLEYLNTEFQMMRDFERQILLQGPAAHGKVDQELLLKLFHMQHYGVPTRLLDWTTNPFIALYFALSSMHEKPKENPAVWVMDPWSWNREVIAYSDWKDRGPAATSDYPVKAYMPQDDKYDTVTADNTGLHPIAILGMYNTERMRAQRGVFTLFGKSDKPMESVYDAEKMESGTLCKIEIDASKAMDVFARLTSIGYTDSVSYPDFHGVAMEIRRTYGYRV